MIFIILFICLRFDNLRGTVYLICWSRSLADEPAVSVLVFPFFVLVCPVVSALEFGF